MLRPGLSVRTPVYALAAVLGLLPGAQALAQSGSSGLAELERSATLLGDLDDIERLQRIYGYYLDRSDWDNVIDLLTDDATAEYGGSGVYVGKASIRKLMFSIGYDRSGLPLGLLREHGQFQPVVHISPDGRTAKGRWRGFVVLGKHGEYARWQAGPYENEYRKEGGKWKISKLRWYETFTVPFEGGWKTQLTNANLGDRTIPPSDRPSTSSDPAWPAVSLPPYHYAAAGIGRPCCTVAGAAQAKTLKPSELGARVSALKQAVQRLEDERDVEILQRTYGYYVDKNLWEQAADLFADDGTLEIGGRGIFVGKKRVLEYLKWLGEPINGRLYDHTQAQPVVHVSPDGTVARGRWRALVFGGDLNRASIFGDVIYENEYKKVDGVWRIAKLHAWFQMYTTLDRGWHRYAFPNTRPEKVLPPDLPPTRVYDMYPGELTAPNHFGNPVTGKPVYPPPPRPRASALSSEQAATELAGLRQRLALLADAQAIENVQNAYGYYLDKWQWDDAASLFAGDATLETGLGGVYAGRARIRQSFERDGAQGLHQGEVNDRIQYQPVIHVAPDGRSAKMRVRQMDVLGRYGKEAFLGGGVQENEFVKVDGVWKISRLHLFTTFLADLEKGWSHGAQPAPGVSAQIPPDRPPTVAYEAFPTFYVPAFHYDNPVTGRPPVAAQRAARGDILIDDTQVYPESITSMADGTVITGSMKGILFRAGPGDTTAKAWVRPSVEDGQQPAIFGVLAHEPSQTLWVCTGGNPFQPGGKPAPTALIALDLASGAKKAAYPFPAPGGVCNDAAVAPDGSVYATDTPNGRLLRLAPGAKELTVAGTDQRLRGIDGLAFAGDGRLYVNIVTRGAMLRVDLRSDGSMGELTELTLSQPIDGPDGLRLIGGNRFVQAEGTSGRITEVVIEGDAAKIRVLREGLNSSPGVTLVGNTAYAIEGKIGYLVDPKLKGQDPGPFRVLAIPLN